jgi:PAP2 superfamily
MRATRARRALLGVLALLAVLATPVSARADSVTDWNKVAAAALQSPGTATPPGAGQGAVSTAHLAMVHVAVHDAVNAIAGCHEPYVSSPAAKRWYSQDAAVAAAAHHVLVNGELGIPDARFPLIEAAYQATLLPIPDGPAKAGGIATGEAAATELLAARAGDGRFGTFRFTESTLPGGWRLVPPATVTDPGAWLKDVTPFVLGDPDRFRGRAPHRLGSRAYAADFNEVEAVGRATGSTRTPDQTAAAEYWGTTNATATMADIIRSVASTQGGTLADHARLLARAYTNAADALIVSWRDKARYGFWRPFTAIREAASDGNDATEADPDWTSLIANPPYPEHPSGLATFGSAVADTMQHFYGRDEATFSGTTPGGVTRQFTSFSQLRDDIVEARIWSGVHFRFADTEAARIGRKVAHWGNRHAFR